MLLVRVPLGVVTVTKPLVAPFGTLVVISVPEATVNVAGMPLNSRFAPVRLFPRILTFFPTLPEVGRVSTKGPRSAERLKAVPQPKLSGSQEMSPRRRSPRRRSHRYLEPGWNKEVRRLCSEAASRNHKGRSVYLRE